MKVEKKPRGKITKKCRHGRSIYEDCYLCDLDNDAMTEREKRNDEREYGE